jgi:hypothetical protein
LQFTVADTAGVMLAPTARVLSTCATLERKRADELAAAVVLYCKDGASASAPRLMDLSDELLLSANNKDGDDWKCAASSLEAS